MELKKLSSEIREEIMEAMVDAIMADEMQACVTINTGAGYLDVCTNEDDEKVCVVCHDDNEHDSPNLESWAERVIPDWDEAISEVDFRGGCDDDHRYDGLDPAFSSWEEVNGMFFRK